MIRALFLLILLAASPALAVPVLYGDYVGVTVIYTDVTEDSGTDPTPLFGTPTVSGDSIDFSPPSFNASATGAGGVDTTDGTLTFGVEAKPGGADSHFIDTIEFSEAGDFTLAGFGGLGTFVSVTANVFIDIFEVDGQDISQINIQDALVFTPSNGDWDLLNDGPGPSVNGIWTGSLSVDLTQVLIDNGIPFVDGVTRIQVTLDNTLIALSESGTSAFIAKKDADGLSVTAVPEPSALALLAVGSLFAFRRLRQRS